MAKGAYIGASGVARKIKKGYIGVSDVARKIKKAYIGVGGVARLCWGGGELVYYGTAPNLSTSKGNACAAAIGNYALVSGVGWNNSTVKLFDVYDSNLTHTTFTGYRPAKGASATSIGNYAVFGFEYPSAYDSSLTAKNISSRQGAYLGNAAASNDNYAIFAGGSTNTGEDDTIESNVFAYNSALTRTNTSLSFPTYELMATRCGDYALFGGGMEWNNNSNVDAFDNSLTRVSCAPLTSGNKVGWVSGAGANIGCEYGLITLQDKVDVYDSALTKRTPIYLSIARRRLAATSMEEMAVFAGGDAGGTVVDTFGTDLTLKTVQPLSAGGSQMCATTLGKYAIIAGGGAGYNVVDVYTI